MNFSAGGVIWAASSAMFSTKGICMQSAFSILGRASSKACVQPPSFLALKYKKATFGGALSVNPSAQADPVATTRAAAPAARANLPCIVCLPLAFADGSCRRHFQSQFMPTFRPARQRSPTGRLFARLDASLLQRFADHARRKRHLAYRDLP